MATITRRGSSWFAQVRRKGFAPRYKSFKLKADAQQWAREQELAVVHGHAHHGTYEGRTPLGKPVYNIAQFVLKPLFGRSYAVLDI